MFSCSYFFLFLSLNVWKILIESTYCYFCPPGFYSIGIKILNNKTWNSTLRDFYFSSFSIPQLIRYYSVWLTTKIKDDNYKWRFVYLTTFIKLSSNLSVFSISVKLIFVKKMIFVFFTITTVDISKLFINGDVFNSN